MNKNMTKQCTEDLIRWLDSNGVKGYDPYDGLSSPLGRIVDKCNPFLGRVFIHALKNLPFNMRPLLGIHQELDAKALGLLGRGYFLLGKYSNRSDLKNLGKDCVNYLIETITEGFSGACWGHPFPYRSSRLYLPANMPSIVSTAYAVQAILDAYELNGDTAYIGIAHSSCNFILKDLQRIGNEHSFLFSYIPEHNVAIHNASLLAAQILARVDNLTGKSDWSELYRAAVQCTLDDQNEDGSWFYDAPESTERENTFIDNFHTGFVLESLFDIYSNTQWGFLELPMKQGLDYYVRQLFDLDGSPRHTADRKGTIDLRDCAQGIIVLSKMHEMLEPEHQDLLGGLIKWTLKHMQNKDGSFSYMYRNGRKSSIPYIRFQAWMLCALSTALSNDNVQDVLP